MTFLIFGGIPYTDKAYMSIFKPSMPKVLQLLQFLIWLSGDAEFHTQMCSIFIFSVDHQGHVNYSGLLEILDIGNVRIDTLDQVYNMSTAGAK